MLTRKRLQCIVLILLLVPSFLITIGLKGFSRVIVYANISHVDSHPCRYSSKIVGNRLIFDNASYFIHHYPEFVCPQNFRNLADWIFTWPENVFNEYIEKAFDEKNLSTSTLPKGSIIYVQCNGISAFFQNAYPKLQNEFVLITGQSDFSVPGIYLHYLENPKSKIIHWFGQNGGIDASRSERFTHIPIGINCFEMAESIRSIHQQYHNYTISFMINNSIDIPYYYTQPFDINIVGIKSHNHSNNKLLLINFYPKTDSTGSRLRLWNELCNTTRNSYITCMAKQPGVDIVSLKEIYRRNRQFPLWLSPRGNGLDCHRTWEALYLGLIPVVWHSTIDPLFTDLPVIMIDDSKAINEQFLRSQLHEITVKKLQQPPVYRFEKLTHAFWRDMILKKSRHSPQYAYLQRNRCWRARLTNHSSL